MKSFCKKHTLIFIIAVVFIALSSNLITGFAQSRFATGLTSSYVIEAVCKYTISLIPLTLMVKWGYMLPINKKKLVIGFLIGAIFILFCIPNLVPFVLVAPKYYTVKWGVIFAVVLACFSIGLMEEAAIRGVVFPLLCEKYLTCGILAWSM